MLTTFDILDAIEDEEVWDIVKYTKYKYEDNVSIMESILSEYHHHHQQTHLHPLTYKLQLTTVSINAYFTKHSHTSYLIMTFHPDTLPSLNGKVFIVTGGNSGMLVPSIITYHERYVKD